MLLPLTNFFEMNMIIQALDFLFANQKMILLYVGLFKTSKNLLVSQNMNYNS